MTDADHVKAFRLFELAQAESVGTVLKLEARERQHLEQCAECASVVETFARQFKRRFLPFTGRKTPPLAVPRFQAGDRVRIVSPGEYHDKLGVVAHVVESAAGDHIYRYHINFVDGGSQTFFGFELESRLEAT